MEKDEQSQAVFLPIGLYGRIEERVKAAASFSSVDEYVAFVLEEVLKAEGEEASTFTDEEEEEVKRRLRGLGYLS
jgi:hypothetical protein